MPKTLSNLVYVVLESTLAQFAKWNKKIYNLYLYKNNIICPLSGKRA